MREDFLLFVVQFRHIFLSYSFVFLVVFLPSIELVFDIITGILMKYKLQVAIFLFYVHYLLKLCVGSRYVGGREIHV